MSHQGVDEELMMPGLGAVELVILAVVLLVTVLIVGAQQQSPGPDPRHHP